MADIKAIFWDFDGVLLNSNDIRDKGFSDVLKDYPYEEVERYIRESVGHNGDTLVARLPNITNIVYGRDVGYKIEQVHLSPELQAISATEKRKELGI